MSSRVHLRFRQPAAAAGTMSTSELCIRVVGRKIELIRATTSVASMV